jgi:hypothetical protein
LNIWLFVPYAMNLILPFQQIKRDDEASAAIICSQSSSEALFYCMYNEIYSSSKDQWKNTKIRKPSNGGTSRLRD